MNLLQNKSFPPPTSIFLNVNFNDENTLLLLLLKIIHIINAV